MNIVKLQDIKLTHRNPLRSYTLTMRKQKEKLRKQFYSPLQLKKIKYLGINLPLLCPSLHENFPCLVSLVFLKRSLVFPILLFSSISLHCSLRKAFFFNLPLLFFGTLNSDGYILTFSPLPLASFLFSAICEASSDSHFAFLHFFFLGMVLITVSRTML